MRKTIFLCLLFPVFAAAQVNRSAKEYAVENIEGYVQTKLFKDQPYKSVSFGDLKAYEDSKRQVYWTMIHSFEILETRYEADRKVPRTKTYKFFFYLDDKMKVKKAETYFLTNE